MSRIALVTGANQGIGFGIVKRLCKEYPDWTVYGTSRSKESGEEACKKLKEEGLIATYLQADLTDESSFKAVRERLVAEHGGLDVLVNNAGIAYKNASTAPYAEKAEKTFATNVFGTNMVCQTLFPILKDDARVVILGSSISLGALSKLKTLSPQRHARYIEKKMTTNEVLKEMQQFVDDVKAGDFADKGWPDDAAYSMSKLGDNLLTFSYDLEFKKTPKRNIAINVCCPGYVSTNMSSFNGHLSVDEGADTPFYLATLPADTDIRGEFVSKRTVTPWK